MSDLQLALIGLGAVIITGVVLFNWWQERRFMRETARRFDEPADDALMQEFHIDPNVELASQQRSIQVEEIFDDIEVPDETADAPATEPEEGPLVEAFAPGPAAAPPSEPVAAPPEPLQTPATEEPAAVAVQESRSAADETQQIPGLDERIDLIAILQAEAGFAPAAILRATLGMPKYDKSVTCMAQDDAGEWQPVASGLPGQHYQQLACAVQLADCSGPISRATLDDFEVEMENLATALQASLQWQGPADPLGYAAELDRFCVEVDVMVGFHIMHGANGQFAGTKLRGLAEAQGMQLHEDGTFHFEDASGTTLFTMGSQDQRPFRQETLRTGFYRGVSFQLDVPRSGRCTDAFNQMVLLARQLESSLEGNLVDDNQRHLGDAEIGRIGQQLELIHARMLERGIFPGSSTALRLFS